MTTTKSKTTKTATEELAAERRAAIESARANQASRVAALEKNKHDEEQILSAWQSGNDTPSAASLSKVRAEAEKLKVLSAADVRLVKRAEAAGINLDGELADLILPVMELAYPIGSFLVDTRESPEPPKQLPHISIVQLAETRRHAGGSLQGEVIVTLHRDDMQTPLTVERLTTHLAAAGINVSIGNGYSRIFTSTHPGGATDVAKIEVTSAYPAVMSVETLATPSAVEGFGRRMALDLEERFAYHNHNGVRIYPVSVRADSTKVGDVHAIASKTTVAVEVDLVAKIAEESSKDVDSAIADIAHGMIGTAHGGLGRVEKAEVVGARPVSNIYSEPGGRMVGLDVVFTSKTA